MAGAMNDGEMAELKVGPTEEDKILITKINGKIHATGIKCTHFGFPLSKGVLFDDKVVCPLHVAAFNVTTGNLESAPGLDGLPVFSVSERDGKHYVHVPLPLPNR